MQKQIQNSLMKKTLIVCAVSLITLSGYASVVATNAGSLYITGMPNPIDVPTAAKAAVARLYPGVKGVKWEKEGSNYEAGLKHNGKQLSLVIDAKGHVLETETTMAVSALPASVREYVTKHYAGKKISEAAEIVDAKGKKTYEAEVGGKDLMFDEKGQFIK